MSRLKPTKMARALRRGQTDAERKLWGHLRNLRALNLRFRRQHPIGPYIVDFVCLEKKLVLEIDGGQHNELMNMDKDTKRMSWLQNEGYRVLRFWNNDVLLNVEGVMSRIEQELDDCSS